MTNINDQISNPLTWACPWQAQFLPTITTYLVLAKTHATLSNIFRVCVGLGKLIDPRTFPPSPPHPGTASGEQQRPESTWEAAWTSQFPLQVHVCGSEWHLHLTCLLSAWTESLFAEPARRILKVRRSTQRKLTAQNFPNPIFKSMQMLIAGAVQRRPDFKPHTGNQRFRNSAPSETPWELSGKVS